MKTRRKTIVAVSLTVISFIVIVGIIASNALWIAVPCQLEFGIPEANALIVHQTIGQIYNQADVVLVGTITESYPCQKEGIVTRMTVDVEEYLKNPLNVDSIRLESRGGEIPGVGGMWVEDQIIYEVGDRALLFLYEPKDNIYKINPYSVQIGDGEISGNELIMGIELRSEDQVTKLKNNESSHIKLFLDSFFGYDKETPVSVAAFTTYDSDTDKFTLYENPKDLEKFGIHVKSVMVTPNIDGTVSFDLPITIDKDAKEGKYFLELLAQTQEQKKLIQHSSWKIANKQIQIIVENEN